MRLIDADALFAWLDNIDEANLLRKSDGLPSKTLSTGNVRYMVNKVHELQYIDAVPVVRCGECKFWRKIESSLIGAVMCCITQGSINVQKDADDFCSYGERRNND